jgi:peroxiredoxin
LRGIVEEIRDRGADLVVVGNGGVEQARAFQEAQKLPFPLYTDPSLESYRRAGLRRGGWRGLSPLVLLHAFRAFRQGFRQTATEGDALQLGGSFVIAAGGRLLFQHVSREAGDHPDSRELLRALDTGAGRDGEGPAGAGAGLR